MINLYLGGAGDSSDKLSKMIGSQFSKTNNWRNDMRHMATSEAHNVSIYRQRKENISFF